MADTSSSLGPASFRTQADALLRKNLTYQKRNRKTNCRLIAFPLFLCILILIFQRVFNALLKPSEYCGPDKTGAPPLCPLPSPQQWPPLLQIPSPEYRAVSTVSLPFTGLPDQSCRATGSCPVTTLVTGNNQTLGQILSRNLFTATSALNSSNLPSIALGSEEELAETDFFDPAFYKGSLYYVQRQCASSSNLSVPLNQSGGQLQNDSVIQRNNRGRATSLVMDHNCLSSNCVNVEAACVRGLNLWRNSSSEVNKEIYQGYLRGNSDRKINEILSAYDFLNSDGRTFNVSIWYNATYIRNKDNPIIINLLRVPRAVNLASNAYLQFLLGSGTKMLFEFVKEMPKYKSSSDVDISSVLGTLFFSWVVLQLFPVVLTSLVYEKQQKLRIMMKMHGLGDGPYLMISYAYFLTISLLYMFVFVMFGSAIGLQFFTLNDYSIQLVFYVIYINLQISCAFLVAALFTNVKTATAVSYICVFGSGLLGRFLFQNLLEEPSFPRAWIVVMELYPGFSLFRGLYEFAHYALTGDSTGTDGMRWKNLSDSENGMKVVLIIMLVEWLILSFIAFYLDQVSSSGSGKSPLFFLQAFRKKHPSSFRKPSLRRQGSKVLVDMEKPDVSQEREKVEQLLLEPITSHAIISDNLRKVYPGRDGNPEKLAVRGLSLALPRAECFGLLGPNGAGKTSFISMMIGLTKPTSGTAYVQGLDLKTQMDGIYTRMGVCPQDNLLWDTLTGREHLLFYGRLKNLKGSALKQAVEESLKSVNLFNGGVADKQAGKYSGGMKRRLSVAISLIGDPKVVYMDEPSTGLDPASRSNLWNVVKNAKQDRAIILTTHSMEEAEALCDRLGIFVDGSLQCIGNAKELKARYGGSYVFTMTTPVDHEEEVINLVRLLSPSAERTYHTSGTQKFEMPKHEVRIADVFHAVETAKSRFPVFAWGFSDTTLEDVFIKVANSAA